MSEFSTRQIRFSAASDQSLLVYFGDRITLEANTAVVRLLRLLTSDPVTGIRDLHPAYCSLLVNFDCRRLRQADLEKILRSHLDRIDKAPLPESRHVEIPVCYGGKFGPDLDEIAELRGLSSAQAIELHSSVTYRVYFLGFVPGFAYLGGLPDELATPRLAVPRRRIVAGSVGIAGNQTGVYPCATPGGWRLIGRTPVVMFRPERPEMSLLSIGDLVRFAPISAQRFAEIEAQ